MGVRDALLGSGGWGLQRLLRRQGWWCRRVGWCCRSPCTEGCGRLQVGATHGGTHLLARLLKEGQGSGLFAGDPFRSGCLATPTTPFQEARRKCVGRDPT